MGSSYRYGRRKTWTLHASGIGPVESLPSRSILCRTSCVPTQVQMMEMSFFVLVWCEDALKGSLLSVRTCTGGTTFLVCCESA